MTLSKKKLAEMQVRVEKAMAYGSDINAMHLASDNMELQTAVEKLRDALLGYVNLKQQDEPLVYRQAKAALLEVFGPSEG